MGVDHGGLNTAVPQKFLNRADVVAVFDQVSCEAVTEHMGRHALGDSRTVSGDLERPGERGCVYVVDAFRSGPGVSGDT